jgi:opacity protein-like surface antigen
VFIPNIGIGFADRTSCLAIGSNVGYQFSNNRISVDFLIATKKRHEYSNGDFKDLLIGNATLRYSRIFKKGSISIVPDLGLGLVTGKWTKHSDGTGEYIQSGFGLAFGGGIEYSPMDHLLLKLSYNQALLIKDFSGNGAVLFGVGLKFLKKTDKHLKYL